VAIRLRPVHPVPTRIAPGITAVYRRAPVCTTNAPSSAGHVIAVKYKIRRKPIAAALGKCHIFAARTALRRLRRPALTRCSQTKWQASGYHRQDNRRR